MNNHFNFELISKDKNARLGKLSTAHGEINTPIFMPVGTAATCSLRIGGNGMDMKIEFDGSVFTLQEIQTN